MGLRASLPARSERALSEVYTSRLGGPHGIRSGQTKPRPGGRDVARRGEAAAVVPDSRRGYGMSLKGDLSELGLADLVEMMSLGAKTGSVTISDTDGDAAGTLLFLNGLLVSASSGPFTGEKAFYALLAVSAGSFFVDSDVSPPEEMPGRSTQPLLMEGMRRLDEVRQLRERLPSWARLALAGPGQPQDGVEAQVVALLSLASLDIADVVRRVEQSGRADEYECLLACDRLRERGLLRVQGAGRILS